jgi:hypothetical protein
MPLAVPIVAVASLAAASYLASPAAAGTPPSAAGEGTTAGTATPGIERLETRLLEAESVRFVCELRSEGAFEADLEGEVVLGPEGRARMELNGSFGGEEMDLLLVSDGDTLTTRAGETVGEIPTPPALREAIVLGLVRMGLLHNAARLTQAAPPDHADTGIGDWVLAKNVEAFAVEIGRGASVANRFEVHVGGRNTATATLHLSPETGLPLRREQTVAFEVGEMHVTERYIDVELDPEIEPRTFAVAD